MALLLSEEMRAWLRPGLAGFIGTVADNGRSELTRLWAVRAREGRDELEAYVLRCASSDLLANLVNGGRAALNLIHVPTYSSRMFKGDCSISTLEMDQRFVDTCISEAGAAFESIGMPPGTLATMLSHYDSHEMVGLLLEVDSVFDQSPKPGAGARL
jgi:hypothetical protein